MVVMVFFVPGKTSFLHDCLQRKVFLVLLLLLLQKQLNSRKSDFWVTSHF